MPLMAYMQVSTVIVGPYLHRSAGRGADGAAIRGLTAFSPVYPSPRKGPGILPIDAWR